MEEGLILRAINSEYKKEGYGYKKVTKENTHWITFFTANGKTSLQMYAYFTEDPEMEKVYDTGIIRLTEDQLGIFINVLLENHN